MNAQLQAWLVQTLDRATNLAGQAYDFAAGELPLFVKEVLLFYTIKYWVMFGVLSILMSVWWPVLKRIAACEERDTGSVVCSTLSGIVAIIMLFALWSVSLYYACMVTFAPRLFLLHLAASLMSK